MHSSSSRAGITTVRRRSLSVLFPFGLAVSSIMLVVVFRLVANHHKPEAIPGAFRHDRQSPPGFLQAAPPVAIPSEFLPARHSLRSRVHRMGGDPNAAPLDAD